MKLLRLRLENFKGAASFELAPNGADCSVYADNGVGKTTLADGFYWLLFGKDSAGRTDFEIKTLGEDGKPLRGLDHTVSAEFDGGLTLTKVYKEKWEAKRGPTNKKTFAGHTTDHYINGVPVQQREFLSRVAGICDERRFRLLTDPNAFAALPWQDRRRMLLEVCGDVTDVDVIASNPKLAKLPEILGSHSIDDYRKILAARKKALNEELSALPARIDEATRLAGSKVQPPDLAPIEAKLTLLQERKAQASAGGELAEKSVALRQLEAELLRAEARVRAAEQASIDEASAGLRRHQSELQDLRLAAERLRRSIAADEADLRQIEAECDRLRQQFAAVKSEAFHGEESCPACGQSLPEERVAAAREKFNTAQAERLAAIQTTGKAKRAAGEELAKTLTARRDELERTVTQIGAAERRERELAAEVPTLDLAEALSRDPEFARLTEESRRLRAEIEELKSAPAAGSELLDAEISAVRAELSQAQGLHAQARQAQEAEARVQELMRRETELAAQAEQIESEVHLCELFIRSKVSLLTDRINAKFAMATFQLFEEQVNGGISEICDITFRGVPWGSLNHGARVNVGLDIINTLAEHFGFAPPVFIDNSESVTSLISTRGQQIRLVVSEPDKTLRVVVHDRAAAIREPQGALI
jgi:hypothetical protein